MKLKLTKEQKSWLKEKAEKYLAAARSGKAVLENLGYMRYCLHFAKLSLEGIKTARKEVKQMRLEACKKTAMVEASALLLGSRHANLYNFYAFVGSTGFNLQHLVGKKVARQIKALTVKLCFGSQTAHVALGYVACYHYFTKPSLGGIKITEKEAKQMRLEACRKAAAALLRERSVKTDIYAFAGSTGFCLEDLVGKKVARQIGALAVKRSLGNTDGEESQWDDQMSFRFAVEKMATIGYEVPSRVLNNSHDASSFFNIQRILPTDRG
jgi:hypothetical protein